MSLSRRALFASTRPGSGLPTGALIGARGREAMIEELWPHPAEAAVVAPPEEGEIRLSSNENPLGPGAGALDAVREAFADAGRYPTNARPSMADLRAALAAANGTDASSVVLGAGSGEILKNAVHAFTSKDRHLVTAAPTYLQPSRVAEYLGVEVKTVAVDEHGRLDLAAMARAARGAGLVFFCNPNNPTSTVHSGTAIREFVARVHKNSPNTVIHFDEAYHEYVTDPAYESAMAMALETPNVFVTRTFSKVYGMAGLRVGYAVGRPEMMAKLRRYALTFNTNTVGVAAAHTTLQDSERLRREILRNTEVRKFTVDFFVKAGYPVYESQTNFIFVNIDRPAKQLRDGCREHNVRVGRDFPPMEKTHARISIGTMEEMQRATEVFAEVLR